MKLAILAALALPGAARADALTFPDRGRAAVVDAAHVLPPTVVADLNKRIVAWDIATKHQLAVATIPNLQGREIADYGYQLGRAWGLGRKGIDDGVILMLAPNERKVRIEVGRGLEPDLTDADTSQIIRNAIVPKLKAGDPAGGLTDGADAIMAAVPANAGDTANVPRPASHAALWILAIICMLCGVFGSAWAFSRRRRKAVGEAERAQKSAKARFEKVDQEIRQGATPTSRRPSPPRYVSPLPPFTGKAASPSTPSAQPIVAPVILNSPTYEAPRRHDDDSPSSSSWGSSSDSNSSSWDSGSSSSGFDSGGGSFSGGGSDSSY